MKKLLAILLLTVPAHAGSVYIDQVGDSNDIFVSQYGTGDHEAILLNQGDGNDLSIIQRDGGNHSAFIGTPPSGMVGGAYIPTPGQGNDYNNFLIYQKGSGDHTAAINLDHTVANNNNTATIDQEGAANKQFTLNLSGSNIGVTVQQDNATTPDSGSMSIQCYTGSCQGYSYIRH